jgi:hypothetical protein
VGAKRTMVLYVVYRASTESKDRSTIPTRLKALGCQQIHRAFWKIDEKKAQQVLYILENNHPILLKRLREIRDPNIAKKKQFARLGSLIIVAFTLPKEANREKVKNFLRKAPCIRLRRSVYAFSQKQSFYDKEPTLVDALKFINFIRENNGDVKLMSRVVVINASGSETLLKETQEHIEKGASDIVHGCKELYTKALAGKDAGQFRERFSRIKRRFFILKKVAKVYGVWLKTDSSKSLMKAYHALRKVHSLLSTE